MAGFRVGVIDPIVAARPTAETFTRASYLGAVASRVDSFWVPDHLNSLFPRSLWQQKYCGATKLIPTLDAAMRPCWGTSPRETGSAACASAWV
jgi:phthiodiolone/phenolphthiodiolone dimycocerosates ketoreductase